MKLFGISRLNLSLRAQTIVVLIMIHSVFVSVFVFYTISGQHKMVEDLTLANYIDVTETFSLLIAEHVIMNDYDVISRHFIQMLENPDIIYIAVYDTNNIILDRQVSQDHIELFNNISQQRMNEKPERIEYREVGHPHGFFHREGHFYNIIAPLYREQVYLGKIQVGINTSKVNRRVAEEGVFGLQLVIGIIFLGMLVIILIDKRIKRILLRFIAITRKMAEGDLSQKLSIRTGDEMEILGNSFNIMAEAIQEREAIIEKHKKHLEQMVEERTAELAKERDKLQAVLNHVPSAIVMLDENLEILMVNAHFESLTNSSDKDVLGKRCSPEICFWCDKENTQIRRCLEDGEIRSALFHHVHDKRFEQHLECLTIPLQQLNKPREVLEIITDVSEKYETQSRLIRAEKLSTTGEFAAMLAHEFRNSLTSIKMLLQLQREKSSESDQESITVALNSISQMENIVENLLHFSRPDDIIIGFYDIHELINESVKNAHRQFEKKQVKIDVEFDEEISKIAIDGENMKKVIINLLLNAFQSIAAKGQIRISTRKMTLDKTISDFASLPADPNMISSSATIHKIKLSKGRTVVEITVSDTGTGMDHAIMSRVFDPFFTTKEKGTGLGLSLVKRIVNAHNGIIKVISDPGKGAKFTIILPVNQ